MKFEEALNAMRKGKKVRLHNWIKDIYIAIDKDEDGISNIYTGGTPCDPSLDYDEIMSQNWEIINET